MEPELTNTTDKLGKKSFKSTCQHHLEQKQDLEHLPCTDHAPKSPGENDNDIQHSACPQRTYCLGKDMINP